MGLTLAATEAQEHGGVDDRDTFLHRVRDLLNIHTGILFLPLNLLTGNEDGHKALLCPCGV